MKRCFAGIVGAMVSLLLSGCGNDPRKPPENHAPYLGGQCNILTGSSCNPVQMPLFTEGSYAPAYLFRVSSDRIVTDNTERMDGEDQVSVDTEISEVSTSTAKDLGLSGKLPAGGGHVAFSGGANFRSLAQTMDVYNTQKYYSLIKRRYITHSQFLSSDAWRAAASSFQDAVKHLPRSPKSDAEYAQWFQFFENHGTHYVKEVGYGGTLRMSAFVSSEVRSSKVIRQSSWGFFLGAMFNKKIGADVRYNESHMQQQMDEFASYTSDVVFHAVGGDQTQSKYQDWLRTVKEKPAPVRTLLGSVEDFLPESIEFKQILERYFSRCPHTDSLGVCNGYGLCDFSNGSCECQVQGAYKEKDGRCYPVCRGNCSGNGVCSLGKCSCFVDGVYNIGYTSLPGKEPCSTACGSHVFDAGSGRVWCRAGASRTNSECEVLAYTKHETTSPTCWCQEVLKHHHGVDIVGESDLPDDQQGTGHDTFDCVGEKACKVDIWPWSTCPAYQVIRCHHGASDCPADAPHQDFPRKGVVPTSILANGTQPKQVVV
ncbi:c9 [Symbiodinium sp. KB8]|nr:c9 [Symbiodinium sp. KB8]